MSVYEASLSGTFRTILVLVILWMVLRFILRMQTRRNGPPAGPTGTDHRRPGEVRIEPTGPSTKDRGRREPGGSTIVDADFEEIT